MLRLVRSTLFIRNKLAIFFVKQRLLAWRCNANLKLYMKCNLFDITKKLRFSPKMIKRKDVYLEQAFATAGKGFVFGGFVLGLVPAFALAAKSWYDISTKVKERFEDPERPYHRRTKHHDHYIARDEVNNEVKKAFVGQTDTLGLVGIIFGPTGTGKSAVVRNVCRDAAEAGQGVVYIDIGSHCQLAYQLAEACGLPVEQRNWYDGLASRFFPDWKMALKLPENDEDALAYVITAIASGCRKYKDKHGHVPTLFIDGAEILADQNNQLFESLVMWAIKCANDNVLQIVLVSSDSHILHALDVHSIKCRLDNLIEIEDVPEEATVKLMTEKFKMPEYLAKKIYNVTGGRLTDVHKAVSMWMNKKEAATNNIHEKDKALEESWMNTLVDEIETLFSLEMEQAFLKAFCNSTQRELELKKAILTDSLALNNGAVDAQKDSSGIAKPLKPPTVEDIQRNMVKKFEKDKISASQVMSAILQLVDNYLLRITKQRTLRCYNRTAQKVLKQMCSQLEEH